MLPCKTKWTQQWRPCPRGTEGEEGCKAPKMTRSKPSEAASVLRSNGQKFKFCRWRYATNSCSRSKFRSLNHASMLLRLKPSQRGAVFYVCGAQSQEEEPQANTRARTQDSVWEKEKERANPTHIWPKQRVRSRGWALEERSEDHRWVEGATLASNEEKGICEKRSCFVYSLRDDDDVE